MTDKSKFKKKKTPDIFEQNLLQAFEKGEFDLLKDLQQKNESMSIRKNFYRKIEEIFLKKQKDPSISKEKSSLYQKLQKIDKNLIVGINQFTIGEYISHGGQAFVYKGTFKYMDIAIKKMNFISLPEKQQINLIKEVLIFQRIRHPKIIKILGYSMDENGNFYILTEYYPNKTILEFIKDRKNIPIQKKVNLLLDVAQAVYDLHTSDPPILHRDIKPQNIFISKSEQAILGDFGIATEFETNNVNTSTCSTIEYMSPETVSQSVYLKESDVYSFGILSYEVLTEEEFLQDTNFELINKIVNQKFRPSLDNLKEFPILQDLIQKCWASKISTRPDFSQICEILTKFISSNQLKLPLRLKSEWELILLIF